MIKAGEKLKEERLSKGLTLADVSKKTKIKAQYLEFIENGQYDKLPSVSYAQGFVRNYSDFLGFPEEEIMAIFRREFDEEKTYRVLPKGFDKKQNIPLSGFKIKQTFVFIILIFVAFVGFLLFQYRYAFLNPHLQIYNYSVSSSEVTINGNTDSNSTVYINQDAVSVDQNGNFQKTISVFSGKTTITIKAVNKFLRETTKQIQIDVKGGS
jgi:cytoskeletal protein RodZ